MITYYLSEVTWVKPDDYREPGEPKPPKKIKRPQSQESSNIPPKKQKVASRKSPTQPTPAAASSGPSQAPAVAQNYNKAPPPGFDPTNAANMGPATKPCAYGSTGWETIEKAEE